MSSIEEGQVQAEDLASSSLTGVSGDAAGFTQILAKPIILDPARKWEMALTRIWLPMPGGDHGVTVTCNCVKESGTGGGSAPWIHIVPPQGTDPKWYLDTPINLIWVPVVKHRIDTIRIECTYGNNQRVPLTIGGEAKPTRLQVLFRESRR